MAAAAGNRCDRGSDLYGSIGLTPRASRPKIQEAPPCCPPKRGGLGFGGGGGGGGPRAPPPRLPLGWAGFFWSFSRLLFLEGGPPPPGKNQKRPRGNCGGESVGKA